MLYLALVLVAALCGGANAHNWVVTPSRAMFASTAKTCLPRLDNAPHVQVKAGQEFEIEWATGHTGGSSNMYFVLLRERDLGLLDTITPETADDYLAKAPSTVSGARWEKYHRSIDGQADNEDGTPAARYASKISSGTNFIPRHGNFKSMGTKSTQKTSTWVYKTANKASDKRAEYASTKYKYMAVHRFHNEFHAPNEFDVARFRIPAGSPVGQYTMYYMWRGYYDCIDVEVVANTVTNKYGKISTNGFKWNRIDHCQFISPFYAYMIPCEDATVSAKKSMQTCESRGIDKCWGVNVVPAIQPKYVAFRNEPINMRTTHSNCATKLTEVKKQGAKGLISYGGRPIVARDTHGEYEVSDDVSDPVFYSTCYYRSRQMTWDNTPKATPKIVSGRNFDLNRCITCAQAKLNDRDRLAFTPHWPISNRCYESNIKC